MQSSAWLQQTEATLKATSIATARLDALVLLEDTLGVNRAHILAHPEHELSLETLNVLSGLVERRKKHEPLAYLRGMSEFYGREFIVSSAVLVPRPESEMMIELLKTYGAHHAKSSLASSSKKPEDSSLRWNDEGRHTWRIADVGTGSGALGITAQLELPGASVELLEVDDAAIAVAKMNVIKFTSGVLVCKTDLLGGSPGNYDVLLCNLPYVPDEYPINQAAAHEPNVALFGGTDGLHLYRRLVYQIQELATRPLLILTEALPEQHAALTVLMAEAGYSEAERKDFIQVFHSK